LREIDMTAAKQRNGTESASFGVGSWTILAVLLLLLGGTVGIVYLGWTLTNGTDVPASGYVAMAIGVLISLGVGFGLMALIFYSSRNGFDEPPELISPDPDCSECGGVISTKQQIDSVPSLE
jgi:hypothetical protein